MEQHSRTSPAHLAGIIAAVFLLTATMDAATTYLALHYRDGVELNSNTDTRSFWNMYFPELLSFVSVWILAELAERIVTVPAHRAARQTKLGPFLKELSSSWRIAAWYVLVLLFSIGAVRSVVVFSNLVYLTTQWSPVQAVAGILATLSNGDSGRGLLLLYIICGTLAVNPLSFLLYRRIRRSLDPTMRNVRPSAR